VAAAVAGNIKAVREVLALAPAVAMSRRRRQDIAGFFVNSLHPKNLQAYEVQAS